MTKDEQWTRLIDYFAEIDAAVLSINAALRHYKQPQDVHFHMTFKACRDGSSLVRELARASLTEE